MNRILARRPSPALVISCIALFVALGGVSYGVATGYIDSREIADNTVRSKDVRNDDLRTQDLRNNDVRGVDIRNSTIRGRDVALNALNGDDIEESKLAKVPEAGKADDATKLGGRAASEYASAAPEAVRLIGATGQPPFEGGFLAGPATELAPGFWKDAFGVVHLQGALDGVGGGTDPVVALTLPVGYRPTGNVAFAVAGAITPVIAQIGSNGAVTLPNNEDARLDGISFRTATTPTP